MAYEGNKLAHATLIMVAIDTVLAAIAIANPLSPIWPALIATSGPVGAHLLDIIEGWR